MARASSQQQPSSGVPPEQALVTPATRPEVLLALQHQQATQAIHNECAGIRQDIGALKAEIETLKTSSGTMGTDVGGIKRFHNIVIGVVIGVAAVIGVIWYFMGSKVSTLMEMADERQVEKLHAADEAKKPPANPKDSN